MLEVAKGILSYRPCIPNRTLAKFDTQDIGSELALFKLYDYLEERYKALAEYFINTVVQVTG